MSVPSLQFNDGHTIPQVGLGVYKIDDAKAADVVTTALEAGYRHIDTATFYRNERGVGEAVRSSGLSRDEIFVTTKVWSSDQGYDRTLRAFDASLERLGLDRVDLYLIHWPAPKQDRYLDTWRALETIHAQGRATSIGVSNFHADHLDRLLATSVMVPVINQVELHPWLPQHALREYNAAHGILTEAWSPLARGGLLGNEVLERIAAKHGKSVAQVVIRWDLQLGVVVIPKSVTPSRIRENIDVFDFELDESDLAAIAQLESGKRSGMHPEDS